ncbi:hypothetical protein F5148DRAFT_303595 [Russula earlei]|uniref:Uncharacterized protein n=1 Tax=Russula earlei TaxID=71964 RepID=A0ACC0UIR1_9AGAM|nr:hypothetical protein F5148DRAFT_303595 [Russula earlei]
MTPSSVPSFGYGTAARRVLAIPELIQTICSYGTRGSNASSALVCRSWSGPALDHVWREVDDLYYLLQVLVPIHSRGEHYEFSCNPTPADWAHFIPYARRVRSLKFGTNDNEKAPRLARSVFDVLGRTRTTLEVLPNLRRLCWLSKCYPQNAIVFMHDKVTEFTFDCRMTTLVADITGRMPSLISLECRAHCPQYVFLRVESLLGFTQVTGDNCAQVLS